MLDAAREAVALTAEKSRSGLDAERLLQLGLTRLLEVIGEAASRVSPDARQRFSGIPWPLVVGIRNRLIHGYDTVDLDVVWKTVKDSLPPFILALEKALEQP
jgi:uncharacterized protein with HEPN domain